MLKSFPFGVYKFRINGSVMTAICGAAALFVGNCALPRALGQANSPQTSRPDAVAQAQQPSPVPIKRPEQNKSAHDSGGSFSAQQAEASSSVFRTQPKQGKNSGIDYYRDPVNADRINEDPDEIMKALAAAKAGVMDAQRRLLESRYNLQPQLDHSAKMSRGKPLAVGPTAKLAQGMTWDRLAALRPEEIRQRELFPYVALPHPLQTNGGMVFPKMQLEMFPRLERVDVDFDLPEAFLPEFPPAIFLSSRPELGDVSR